MRPRWIASAVVGVGLAAGGPAWAEAPTPDAPLPEGPVPEAPVPEALPAESPAEKALLKGRIRELGTGDPLAAEVRVGEVAVVAGPDGRFELEVPAGALQVLVQDDDHRQTLFEETVEAGQILTVEYHLDRGSWDEIHIYGEPRREEVSRQVFSMAELTAIPGSFGDPVRALQSLPGVARPSALEGDLVVRGAEGSNTRFYVDDLPVPYLFHAFVGRSVLSPSFIDDLEFFPGGMPSRFGDVTQAVVNARTGIEPAPDRLHGRVSFDILDASVGGSVAKGPWEVEVAGRHSWVGGLVAAGTGLIGAGQGLKPWQTVYAYPYYFDGNGRIAWRGGGHKVSADFMGSRDSFFIHFPEYDEDGDGKPDGNGLPKDLPYDPQKILDSGFFRARLRWDYKEEGLESTTWVAAGPDHESNLLQGIGLLGNGLEFGKVSGFDAILFHEQRRQLSETASLRSGLRLIARPVTVENWATAIDPEAEVPTSRDLQLQGAGWMEYAKQLGPWWVSPGFRGSVLHFQDKATFEPEPRLSVRRTLSKRWTFTGFAGRFAQIPPEETYTAALGNTEIGRIEAWQLSTGIEGRWPNGLQVDVSAYITWMNDLVVKDREVRLRDDTGDPFGFGGGGGAATATVVPVFRPVNGLAFGVEGLVRFRPRNGWFGWVGLTLSRAIRIDDRGTWPGTYDQPLAVVLIGARTLPKGWRLSSRFRTTSGHPYTPLYETYNPENDSWDGFAGPINSGRFPWFWQLDARIDKTWTLKRARWTLYLDAYNATNAKNPLLVQYVPNFSRTVTAIWIPILPTLGLEVAY